MIKFISDHHCKSLMVERMVGKEEDLDDDDNVAEKAVRAGEDDKEGNFLVRKEIHDILTFVRVI